MKSSPTYSEQDYSHRLLGKRPARLPLAWFIISSLGTALAAAMVAGVVAGRLDVPIEPRLLVVAAGLALVLNVIELGRRRCEARWPEAILAFLAFGLVSGVGLLLAWPSLLPLGRSVDAVHQYQLVHWIAVERRLPPLDARTQGLMGEMIAYPPGFAITVAFVARLFGQPTLNLLYPIVAVLGGVCAALVALISTVPAQKVSWRMVLPGLASTLLLLAHRAYMLEAYIDHSYYAMVLGMVLVLLIVAWLAYDPHLSWLGCVQIGLLLAALFVTYPLWVPIPALFALLMLIARWRTSDDRRPASATREPTSTWTTAWRSLIFPTILVFLPVFVLALVDAPKRFGTGQTVLAHEGVVTLPTLFSLTPVVLALPATIVVLVLAYTNHQRAASNSLAGNGRRQSVGSRWSLVAVTLIALAAMGALALAAQVGLTAIYHSYKILFVITPLAAAIVGAAAIQLGTRRSFWRRWSANLAVLAILAWTSGRFVLPIAAVQLPTPELVSATRWLLANEPRAAEHAILVNGPPGQLSYWVQVGLLEQWRDEAQEAMRAFTTTPSTAVGWAMDPVLPEIVVALNQDEPPPGAEELARFGNTLVLRRAPFDVVEANPLIIRYSTFWEEDRLKTALELIRPVAGQLPLIELRLDHNGKTINTFALQPNPERTKNQYLGADVIPATLGGMGYINAEAYPTFAPPAEQPVGSFTLTMRLSLQGVTLDERLLATFDRQEGGAIANLSVHSGELDYIRRWVADEVFQNAAARFDTQVELTGWHNEPPESGAVRVKLRWRALAPIERVLETEIQLLDQAGDIVARDRGVSQNGFYPSWRWRPGEDIVELRTITLPQNLPAGTYTLVVNAYDTLLGRDMTLTKGSTQLGELVVERGG